MLNQALIEKWKLVYAQAEKIDELSDKGGADYESLCVGFCLANGLTVEESFDFYRDMIPLNLF